MTMTVIVWVKVRGSRRRRRRSIGVWNVCANLLLLHNRTRREVRRPKDKMVKDKERRKKKGEKRGGGPPPRWETVMCPV